MPTLPRRKVGDSVAAMEQNRLLDYIQSLRPLKSPGIRTMHTTGGVLRVPSPAAVGGGGLTFRGMWSSAESYEEGDIVTVVGSGQGTWICQVAHGPSPDDHAPYLGEDDGTDQYWTLMIPAAAGAWV